MPSFTLEKHVDAPPERVFAAATDFRRAPETIRGIVRMEILTEGPVGVGTRFKETRVMFKREATEEMQVTRFDPPHGYELTCENHGCRYVTTFRMQPRGAGTDVEMTFDVTPLTTPAKVMGFLMRPLMKSCLKEIAKDLEDLAAAVEVREEAVAT